MIESDARRIETVGIIGGGQLGRMLVQEGVPMGFEFVVVEQQPNSPAKSAHPDNVIQIIAPISDRDAILRAARESDVTTIEVEHVNAEALLDAQNEGNLVLPDASQILLIQSKYRQKQAIHELGLPVAPFMRLDTLSGVELKRVAKDLGGFPIIAKLEKGGFDARGNYVVSNASQAPHLQYEFEERGRVYAEKLLRVQKEFAVAIAVSPSGELAEYNLVDMYMDNGILDETLTPARLPKIATEEALDYARALVRSFNTAGSFTIEMFLTYDGRVVINEVAPRIHNSGHATLDANETSHAKQHLLAITGQPLGDPSMVVPNAAMKNLLTFLNPAGIEQARKIPSVTVNLYDKSPRRSIPGEPQERRKVGHVTAVGISRDDALARVRHAHLLISKP